MMCMKIEEEYVEHVTHWIESEKVCVSGAIYS